MTADDPQAPDEQAAEAQPVDDDPAGLKALAQFAEQVRSSARWLIGAFAAVGALLVPTIQLAEVGGLEGPRQAVAVVTMVIAAAMIIASVTIIVRFLSPGRTSLAELAEREATMGVDDRVVAYFHRNTGLYQGQADSLGDLHRRYTRAREQLAEAEERITSDPAPAAAPPIQAEIDALSATADRVLAMARLLGPPDLSLHELAEAEAGRSSQPSRTAPVVEYLRQNPELLGDVESVSKLRRRLITAHESLVRAEAADAESDTEAQKALVARYRLETIEQPIVQIEAVAAYQDLRLPFERWRWFVAVAAAVVAISMAGFAIATSPPERSRSDLSDRTFERLDLSGAKLEGANLENATFRDSNLAGTDLDGANLDGTRFEKTTCPSGRPSQDVGVTCPGSHRKVLRKPTKKKPALTPESRGPADG